MRLFNLQNRALALLAAVFLCAGSAAGQSNAMFNKLNKAVAPASEDSAAARRNVKSNKPNSRDATPPPRTQTVTPPMESTPAPASAPAPAQSSASSAQNSGGGETGDWDLKALDAARGADYLSDVEKDVVLEMNMVRSNPKKYAELYIRPKLQYFNGNRFSVPGEITVITQEGAAAVQECIEELSRAEGVGPLTPEPGLSRAAKDHAADIGATGKTGHDGGDGSTMSSRIRRYGSANKLGENISYGRKAARDIITQLLIDDGVESRGHRKNIMNKDYTQTGVSCGPHLKYGSICVIDYARGYVGK